MSTPTPVYAFDPCDNRSSHHQPVSAARRANGTNVADLAHRAFVLRVIFDPVERTADALLASVDGRVRRAADVKVAERVKLDIDRIRRRAFSHCLDLSCLFRESALCHQINLERRTHGLFELGIGALFDQRVGEAKRAAKLLVLVREHHG